MSNNSCLDCTVPTCTTDPADENVEYFPFPESKKKRYKWLVFCGLTTEGLEPTTLTSAHICSKHFAESAYLTEIKEFGSLTCLIRVLDPDAVPTLNPPIKEDPDSTTDTDPHVESLKLRATNQALEKQIKNLNLPKANIKLDHIKTQEDLSKLKFCNKILKKKVTISEYNIAANERYIKSKEQELAALENEVDATRTLSESVLPKIFSKNQIKLVCGNQKTRWTIDDLAIGCTIRFLSNKMFYEYLIGTLNFPVPGTSTIKRYINMQKKKRGTYKRSHIIK